MANALAITLHASGAENASGVSAAVDIGDLRSCAKLRLQVDAISGASATLDVSLETAPTTAGPWRTVDAFSQATLVDFEDRVFADCTRFVRVSWKLEGTTPTATFTVSGNAHTLYAKLSDVVAQIPKHTIEDVARCDQAIICLAATDEADGYLAGGYTLPLLAWDDNLSSKVADIAIWGIMYRRGFQPQGTDELLVKAYDDAIAWLSKINQGRLQPPGIVDSTPTTIESGLVAASCARRGW